MSEMKISPTDDCTWLNEDCTLMIDGETPKETEIAAGKINNHDRMVEEIAELQAALELMVLHFESNHNSEHECEVIKLSKKILPNLNQEGEE
ncbi:hypothetical protein [Vibrio phage 2E1]|nr:hypothetical protein [Vibrio phage 2E1]